MTDRDHLETTAEDLAWFKDYAAEYGHTDDGDLYRLASVAHSLLRDFDRLKSGQEMSNHARAVLTEAREVIVTYVAPDARAVIADIDAILVDIGTPVTQADRLDAYADKLRAEVEAKDDYISDGWAVRDENGCVNIRTVTDSRRGAIVNWLLLDAYASDAIEAQWLKNKGSAEVVQVSVREGKT
jgi:hypothetical protein